tara:strand:- start:2181 stop:4745 length:2565 start_codon:yes stop_codon:yes gene_type:complete
MAEIQKIIIQVDTGGAQKSVKALGKETSKVSKSAKNTGKGLSTGFAGLKQGILSAIPALNMFKIALVSTGVGAIVVAVGALIGVLAKAAKAGADFQKGVSTLSAVTGMAADELTRVTEQAKELGATTAFTAMEVLGLQTELAKLGFSLQDIENSTPAILDLAASLEVDLSSAAAFAGSTIKGFGLDTSETQRIVDVMALSTSKSALDFEKLRESMKLLAPTANAAGVSIERSTALLAAMADRGISGSMAGTGLGKTFIELSKQGLTLEDAMDQVNGSSNKLNTAIELVGINGGRALLSLASTGKEKLNELEQEFINAEGSAQRMAEVRLDNLEGDMTKLGSAWEGFLLGVEDGEGPLNELQRTLVQGLTWAIGGLGKVVDFLAFAFRESMNDIKLKVGGTVDIAIGYFTILGNGIKLFANKAMSYIAEIPIIGTGIDKAKVAQNIKEAKDGLIKGAKQIQEGVAQFKEAATLRMTAASRFMASQEGKAERVEQAKQHKETQAQKEVQAKEDAETRKKRLAERKKELEKLKKLTDKYTKEAENLEDTTNVAKVARQRERALAELDAVKLSATEKAEAKKKIEDLYDQKEITAKEADALKTKEDKAKEAATLAESLALDKETEALSFEEQRAIIAERKALLLEDDTLSEEQKAELMKQYADAEEAIEDKKRASRQQTLDNAIAIAGAESGVGKALLVAKQLLAAKELVMDIKSTIASAKAAVQKSTVKAAEAGADVAAGAGKTASIGFPQNIPMIIGYAAQAVGIISAIKSATSKAKSVAAQAGASGGGGASIAAPTASAGSAPPEFNIVGSSETNQLADAIGGQSQTPIQTYVVANDVTTSQSLNRNIVDGASLG